MREEPNPCCKCGDTPEIGENYSQFGNDYSGYAYVSCLRCLRSYGFPIDKSLLRAREGAIAKWNEMNPLPETEGEG